MIYLQLPCFTKTEAECDTLFDCFFRKLAKIDDVEHADTGGAIREGHQNGLEEGMQKGVQMGMQKAAQMLLESGMPIEQISATLHIDIAELEKMKVDK